MGWGGRRIGQRTDIQWVFNAFCLICPLVKCLESQACKKSRNTLGLQKPLVLGGERDGRDGVVIWGRKRKKRELSRFEVTSSKLRLKTNAKIMQTQVFCLS